MVITLGPRSGAKRNRPDVIIRAVADQR